MKKTELKVFKRDELNRQRTKQLRSEGKIPSVLYDNGSASHMYSEYQDTKKVVFTAETYVVNLQMEDGTATDAIIREVQYHPTKDTIEHIDFLKVADDQEVVVTLPIRLSGTATGVVKGGKLITKLRKLKVKGIPSQLPDSIEVNISKLDLGETIKVGQANIEGMKIITPPTAAIASVEIPRTLRSKEAETKK